MKEFLVEAFIPEVASHAANQAARVRASRLDLAAKLGLSQIMRRPHIKGKRIKTVRVSVTFVREIPYEWRLDAYVWNDDHSSKTRSVLPEFGPFKTRKLADDAIEGAYARCPDYDNISSTRVERKGV